MKKKRPLLAEPFRIAGHVIAPGTMQRIELPIARLHTGSMASLPVCIIHGARQGKRLWLTGAIHGDELNGVELIRQIIQRCHPKRMRGTVLAVPVVNVFGFLLSSRYLPDRRDLNRCFPGSTQGSLGGRIAHLLMKQVVASCDAGIDIHTGSNNRTNIGHIRADLRNPVTRKLAKAFGTSVILHAPKRAGSLREAAQQLGIPTLLYEVGEAERLSRQGVAKGVEGVLRVMVKLGIFVRGPKHPDILPHVAMQSSWIRAKRTGLARITVKLGQGIGLHDSVATINQIDSMDEVVATSPRAGIVIGYTRHPLVNRGDALVHVAH